jgi:hypothetical protein
LFAGGKLPCQEATEGSNTMKRRVIGELTPMDENTAVILAVREGKDLFLEQDGVKIAKRGRPNPPQAMTWIPLIPDLEIIFGMTMH